MGLCLFKGWTESVHLDKHEICRRNRFPRIRYPIDFLGSGIRFSPAGEKNQILEGKPDPEAPQFLKFHWFPSENCWTFDKIEEKSWKFSVIFFRKSRKLPCRKFPRKNAPPHPFPWGFSPHPPGSGLDPVSDFFAGWIWYQDPGVVKKGRILTLQKSLKRLCRVKINISCRLLWGSNSRPADLQSAALPLS